MQRLHVYAKIFRMNARVLLIMLVLFIVADVWVSTAFHRQIQGDGVFRLNVEDRNVLQSYLEIIGKDNGRKVLFIGDSVMFGSAALSDEDTIPAQVAVLANQKWPTEEIHYYNLGIKGLAIADAYYLLRALETFESEFDLIVYDVNIGWFNDNLINRTLVLDLLAPELIDWQDLGLERPSFDLSTFLDTKILKYWKLYYYNQMVNGWLFGKPVTKKIRESANHFYYPDVVTEEEIFHQPWFEKKWDHKFEGDWKLGSISFDNQQWKYFQLLLDQMKMMSKETLLFLIPRNHTLLNQYDKYDEVAMNATNDAIIQLSTDKEIDIVNYEFLLEDHLFSDTVHPLPSGNAILAEKVVEVIEQRGLLSDRR